uniref:SEC7 domain-containing protein n=1 Tax=Peronospora matthiolae TaxID=2874970 RepID=A0AAV1U7P7_9STRA
MAAVRAVLLSDIQSVLSLARHQYGYLISKTASLEMEDESPVSVLQSLLTLRGRLLYCYDVTELSPLTVIKPFLDVIQHNHTSSAVTSASLQALMSFVQLWPWVDVQDENVAADTVSDIVDAVSHCSFQAESVEGDQNALVLVAHVLHAVMRSPYGARLSDHSMWQLVQSLYALNRGSQSDSRVTLPLRSTAAIFLHDTVTFVFSNPAIYADSASAANTEPSLGTGFGLPCAVKIVGFLCQKLHQRNDSSPPDSDAAISSIGSTIRQREVLLSFSLLECALVACDAELIMGVSSLMFFIKDDLCKAVLRYCRLGACAERNISIVCLKIIRLLWSKLRSEIKMQIEAIFDGVFYHTLYWCLSNMNVNNPDFPRGDDVALSVENMDSQRDDKPAALVESALDDFTGDMLSKVQLYSISFEIFDCLVDLLAEATLLTDLYVNYDCDDNRCDLTQTLFGLLSQVAQQSHVACFESHEESHFLWAQAIGEIALRGLYNSLHVVYTRTQQNVPVLDGKDSSGSSDNEDALEIKEDKECLLTGSELVSAVALCKKQKRKKFFQRGIQEFNRKPLAGIKYLQQNGFLPIPLDSKSFAMFLRSLPQDLSKTSVGVYLGAIGKEVKGFEKSDIHEADTIDFHRDVLTDFVRSFNFEGESIVTALRMFLASFRLPGEAQQIDRILNAFSLQVYEQCRERFVMASMDVAYLLSFSLIMLNTDLHNPNIRGDKKMKLADFIKNNKNYGHEVSNGLDLPEDFLAELYNAIANEEIRTFEDGGKHGEVTSVRWKDLLNRAESDPRNSRLIMLRPSLRFQSLRAPCSIGAAKSSASPPVPGVMQSMTQTRRVPSVSSPTNGAAKLHESDTTWKQRDELKSRYASSGDQYDRHIYELVQQNLVRAFSSVFQQFVVDSQARDAARGEDLSVGSGYEMHYVPQKSALQFACNGLVLCATVAYHLSLVEYCNSVFVRLCKYTALLSSDIYSVGYNGRENGARVYCDNQSAPVATAAVLKLLSTCSLLLRSRSWKYFFHVVNGLREFHVVPSRILYPSDDMKSELMTAKERLVFIDLVYQNKEKLDRKTALSAQDEDGGNGDAGGFFSSVAWLLSAIDSSVGSSASTSGTTTSSHCSPWYQLSPAELASHADDLILGENAPAAHTFDSEHDPRSEVGSDQWIRTSLEPYRLDFLYKTWLACLIVSLLKLSRHCVMDYIKHCKVLMRKKTEKKLLSWRSAKEAACYSSIYCAR